MSSVYMTEEEQLESIKKWWARYGNMITLAITLVLLCVAGYRYYYWHQAKITQQASSAYEHMIAEISSQNNQGVRSYANELTTNYKKSVYADAAHLSLAKLYITKNKFDKAIVELQNVADHSKMPALRQIAKIRIARLLAATTAYDKALNELNQVEDKVYLPVVNELKGDIYTAQGNYQQAIQSYQLAMQEVKTNGMGNAFLEMKRNELVVKKQKNQAQEKKIEAT